MIDGLHSFALLYAMLVTHSSSSYCRQANYMQVRNLIPGELAREHLWHLLRMLVNLIRRHVFRKKTKVTVSQMQLGNAQPSAVWQRINCVSVYVYK